MRTLQAFDAVHIVTKPSSFEQDALSPLQQRHAPNVAATSWKSPVPYLFGGLAAMLGLIAFALIILACSYWKLSGDFDSGEDAGDGDGDDVKKVTKETAVFANSVLVIMAGEEKPTFLAMPAGNTTTAFGDGDSKPNCSCSCSCSSSSNTSDDNDNDHEKENGEDKLRMTHVITES